MLSFGVLFTDNGNGVANINPILGGAPTFTRAGPAWTRMSNGLWISLGNNVPKSIYPDQVSGRYDGLWLEGTKTNLCLWNRDLTNAVWVKSNMTVAKDQVGVDGVTNSCSSMTATAGGATVLQSFTLASAARHLGLGIRRLSGTGTLEVTQDGTTWTDITASASSSFLWGQFLIQTVLNPVIGFRIGTSGDSFATDLIQLEDASASGLSSPITTTTVATARAAESLSYPSANIFPTNNNYTIFAVASKQVSNGQVLYPFRSLVDATNYTLMQAPNLQVSRNIAGVSTSSVCVQSIGTLQQSRLAARVSSITGADAFSNGKLPTTHDATTTASQIGTTIDLGMSAAGAVESSAAYLKLLIFKAPLTDMQIQSLR